MNKILDFLEKKGIDDNTIIIYTSDHGEMFCDFGVFFKSKFYNPSVRIPFMLSYKVLFLLI
ncbi:MAG: sulfatase-like hydrolase/transferase [Clostridiales bacterium]|nr:sulfatase-like hydrolase/transferase [Clostridiales bacterium]